MTREEARAIAYGDREIIVELLLQLSARIEELERKVALLTKDSSNSSKPPSSDGPSSRPAIRRRKKSRHRKPGGQPGHKGTNRDLVPIEKVDLVQEVLPQSRVRFVTNLFTLAWMAAVCWAITFVAR